MNALFRANLRQTGEGSHQQHIIFVPIVTYADPVERHTQEQYLQTRVQNGQHTESLQLCQRLQHIFECSCRSHSFRYGYVYFTIFSKRVCTIFFLVTFDDEMLTSTVVIHICFTISCYCSFPFCHCPITYSVQQIYFHSFITSTINGYICLSLAVDDKKRNSKFLLKEIFLLHPLSSLKIHILHIYL